MSVHPVVVPKALEDGSSPSVVPEGWAETTLDNLLETLESGSRPKGGVRGIKDGVPSIGGEHLNKDGGFRFEKVKFVPKRFFQKMNRGHIRVGDILVVKDGATTGKVSLVRPDFPYSSAVVNEHVFICRSCKAIHPPFLFYFLFSELGQARILESFRGSAQGGINQSFALNTAVPFAPLAEQKRIVAKIEELLARVNATRSRLAKVPAILKRFRQAVLAAACSGRLTEDWREEHGSSQAGSLKYGDIPNDSMDLPEIPDGWTWQTISKIATVQGGIQKQPKRAPWNNAYPYLRVANVLRDKLDLSEIHQIELFEGEIDTYRLEPNDLLIVEGNGSLTEIGRSALWDGMIANCVHQNHIIRVRAHACSSQYLNFYWNSPVGIGQVAQAAVTTSGLYSLSTRKVAAVSVPLPPIDEQNEIVHRIGALFKLADTIGNRVDAGTKQAERLGQAILINAFRGELVPTEAELARRDGRSYEPALNLLARTKVGEGPRKDTDHSAAAISGART
jgi:type I restriction enzyme S subunit